MSGIINSAGSKSGVIGFKTPVALAYGSATGDQSPVKNSAKNYTLQLNTEDDPYNIISISSNVVTVSYGGMYIIDFITGNLLLWSETNNNMWCHLSLHKDGSRITSGNEFYLSDSADTGSAAGCGDGTTIYRVAAGDEYHLELDTYYDDQEPLGWQGGASTGGESSFARIKFTRVGE